MDSTFWIGALCWALTIATAAGSLLFGQLARQSIKRYPVGHLPSRVRVGVVLSIAGPLVIVIAGFIVAIVSGQWIYVALGTFVALILITVVGWVLAPR